MPPTWIDRMEDAGATVARHPGGEMTTQLDTPWFGLGVAAGARGRHVFLSGAGVGDAALAAIVAGLLAALDVAPPGGGAPPDWFALMESEGAANAKVLDWGRSISLRKVSADGRMISLGAISGDRKMLTLMADGDEALLTAAVGGVLAALEGHRPWQTW